MNEFVVILKWINLKNGKLKNENLKIFKFNSHKKNYHSRSNLFSNTPKKQSKRIIETEPTGWLQSNDTWKFRVNSTF